MIIISILFPNNMAYIAGILGGIYFVCIIDYQRLSIPGKKEINFLEVFKDLNKNNTIYALLLYGIVGLILVNIIITYFISPDAIWIFSAFVNFVITYNLFNNLI